jgi:hypothetical protein
VSPLPLALSLEMAVSSPAAADLRRVSRGTGVSVQLSAVQVDGIMRAAADRGSLAVLLCGRGDLSGMLTAGLEQLDDPRLSRSLLLGLLVLASFPGDGSEVGIAELARMSGISQSTTHRYVSTLVAVGLLERAPDTRRYRLSR